MRISAYGRRGRNRTPRRTDRCAPAARRARSTALNAAAAGVVFHHALRFSAVLVKDLAGICTQHGKKRNFRPQLSPLQGGLW